MLKKLFLMFLLFLNFKSYPQSALDFYKMADDYFKKKLNDEAIIYYTKAIELDPNFADAYFYRGKCYDYQNDYIKAINDFIKASSLNKKINRILKENAYFYYYNEKKYDLALLYFISYIESAPDEKEKIIALFKSQDRFFLNISYDFINKGKTTKLKYITLIPEDYENRQKVYDIKYSIEPTKKYIIDNNSYVEFLIENPEEKTNIDINIEIDIFKYDLQEACKNNIIQNKDTSKLQQYLIDEKYIEKDNPDIKAIAARFNDNNCVDLVKKIYNFVLNHMNYKYYQRNEQGALFALKNKGDDCSEYSDLFVALCRAKNIPARVVSGFIYENGIIDMGHAWAEVYFDEYGWVPFDPTFDDTEKKGQNNTDFDKLLNVYIYLQFLRKDEILEGRFWNNLKWWGDKPETIYKSNIKIIPKIEYYDFFHLISSFKLSTEKFNESYNNLKKNKLNFKENTWEYSLADYLTDNINLEELLKKAENNNIKLCEAYCYIGYKNLFNNNISLAREYFKKCIETNQKLMIEYNLAKCELK